MNPQPGVPPPMPKPDEETGESSPEPARRLLGTPAQYRECLFSLLQSAREEILLEFYIFEEDEFGEQFLHALESAATRGVKVRMLVDGFGSKLWLQQRADTLKNMPLEIRIYHPVPWSMRGLRQALRSSRDFLTHIGSFNRRDHRKLVLVDRRLGIIGSHNLWKASLLWHEASLLLDEKCATAIWKSFERVWNRSSNLDGKRMRFLLRSLRGAYGRIGEEEPQTVLDNTTIRQSRVRSRALLTLTAHARERLWITTPYLMPHRTMLRRIKERAEAGVDVKLILPRRSDVPLSLWLAQTLYSDLLRSGVEIHEFMDGILHAKIMVSDDRFMLGSSNLNHRSFFQDLEIDYCGDDPELLHQIERWNLQTLDRCEQVSDIGQIYMYPLKKCLASLVHPLKGFF